MSKNTEPGDSDTPVERATMKKIVAKNGERPDCFRSTIQEILFVLTCTMAIGMNSFTIGAVTVITSFIQKDLNMTNAEVTWISASSALSSGSLLLFFGSVADLFGRKSMFIVSMGLFAVFCLAAGFSKTGLTLDILSGMLGIFSASAVPPAQGILGVIYEKPSKRKNHVFACFSAGNPLGFVFGSIFSGVATHLFSWRASFWLLAIIYLVFTVIALFTVPNDTSVKQPLTWQTLKKFDIVGTVLTIGGIGMFSASLSLGGDAPHGWKTPYVLVLLVLGILAIGLFIFWETKYEHAMIPMNIWRDRDFSLVMSIMLLGFLAFPILSFWVSLYLQRVEHMSALNTAVHLLPMAIMGIIANIIAALILHKISNKLLMGIGASSYALCFLLAAVNRHGDSYWAFIFPALIFSVIGADFEFNVANMYVLSSLPPDRQSIAGSIFQTVTKLCIAVGFGVATAIFNAVSSSPAHSGYYKDDLYQPYAAVFWFGMASSAASVPLVFWLQIGTQGHEGKSDDLSGREEAIEDDRNGEKMELDEPERGLAGGQKKELDVV